MAYQKKRLSELPTSTSTDGLYTLGVDAQNEGVKIPFGEYIDALYKANQKLADRISEFDGVYTSAEIVNLPAGTYYDTDEKIFVAKDADGSIAEAAIGDLEGSTIYKCGDRLYHFNDRKLVRYVDEADEVFSDIGMRLGGINYFVGIVPTIDDVPIDDPAAVYYVRAMKEFRKANDLSGANVLNVYNDKNPAQARKDIFFCCTADGKFYTYNETAGDLKELHGDAINSLRNGIILAGNAAKAAQSTADKAAGDIELLRDAIEEADYASKDDVTDAVSNAIAAQNRAIGTQMREVNAAIEAAQDTADKAAGDIELLRDAIEEADYASKDDVTDEVSNAIEAQNRAIGTQMREVNAAITGVATDLLETKTDLGDRLGVAEMDIKDLTGQLASLKEGSGCAVMPFLTTTKGLQGGTTPSEEKGESGNVVLNLSSGLFLLQSGSKFYADFEGSEQYGTVTSEGVRPVAGKLYVNRRGGEIYYLKGSALVTVANSADIAELQEAINALVPREKGSTFRLTGTMPDGYTEADCVFNGEPFEVDAEGRFDLIDPKYAPESYEGLYLGRFKTIDYISADPEKFTSAKQMFAASKNKGGVNLKRVNLSGLDTRNVTSMASMFIGNSELELLDVSVFNTSNVTDFSAMFAGCQLVEELDVSGFDTSKATVTNGMFSACKTLKALDVSHFDMRNVTNMATMFGNCCALQHISLSGWDTSNVERWNSLFNGCESLSQLDLSMLNTSKGQRFEMLCKNCSSLRSVNLSGWDTSQATILDQMFYNSTSLQELDLSHFCTDLQPTWGRLVLGCTSLRKLNLSGWDMSGTPGESNLSEMFGTLSSLEELNLSHVQMKANEKSGATEILCRAFNDLPKLRVADFTGMEAPFVRVIESMFSDCINLERVILRDVRLHEECYVDDLFPGCSNLHYVDMRGFYPNNVVPAIWGDRVERVDSNPLESVYVDSFSMIDTGSFANVKCNALFHIGGDLYRVKNGKFVKYVTDNAVTKWQLLRGMMRTGARLGNVYNAKKSRHHFPANKNECVVMLSEWKQACGKWFSLERAFPGGKFRKDQYNDSDITVHFNNGCEGEYDPVQNRIKLTRFPVENMEGYLMTHPTADPNVTIYEVRQGGVTIPPITITFQSSTTTYLTVNSQGRVVAAPSIGVYSLPEFSDNFELKELVDGDSPIVGDEGVIFIGGAPKFAYGVDSDGHKLELQHHVYAWRGAYSDGHGRHRSKRKQWVRKAGGFARTVIIRVRRKSRKYKSPWVYYTLLNKGYVLEWRRIGR